VAFKGLAKISMAFRELTLFYVTELKLQRKSLLSGDERKDTT